jgi:predicted dehydrogenase
VSATPARAKTFAELFSIPRICVDKAELVALPEIDAVYIANLPRDHMGIAIRALRAGKAVLCEKPFATSTDEGAQVIAAAAVSGALFMENLWTLLLPAHLRMKNFLQGGAYGDPVRLAFEFGYPVRIETYPEQLANGSGGVLLDRAVYGLAAALDLLGSVESLSAVLDRAADGTDISACVQLGHAGGASSQIGVSFSALMANTITLACTEGMLGLSPSIGAETVFHRMMAPAEMSRSDLTRPGTKARLIRRLRRVPVVRRLNRIRVQPGREHCPYGGDQYAPLLRHFVETFRSGRSESGVIPKALSQEILSLVDAARHEGSQSAGAVR